MTDNYELIRSRRRTISIEVTNEARVLVRAPLRMANTEIMAFIQEKQRWIAKQLQRIQSLRAAVAPKQFVTGEQFYFLGVQYPLQLTSEPRLKLHFQAAQGFSLHHMLQQRAQWLFGRWYKQQAKQLIPARVQEHAARVGLNFRKITITNARRQWGSCSPEGNLCFTWRLIMAPWWVIDYVILHELAHLLHHNHSRRFWARVEKWYPNYKLAEQWLKENEFNLTI